MSSTRYSCRILKALKFSPEIFEKLKISNFMKIRPVGTELFHADTQTDRHDEADSRFFANLRKR